MCSSQVLLYSTERKTRVTHINNKQRSKIYRYKSFTVQEHLIKYKCHKCCENITLLSCQALKSLNQQRTEQNWLTKYPTRARFLRDVTDTDSWAQNGRPHGRDFQASISSKQDQKSGEKLLLICSVTVRWECFRRKPNILNYMLL